MSIGIGWGLRLFKSDVSVWCSYLQITLKLGTQAAAAFMVD